MWWNILHTNKQWQTLSQIPRNVGWCHLFSFSLWLNKHTVFLATRCWLIVQEDSFPQGGPGQLLCQAWEHENGGDRMLMRRPEAVPPTALPWSAPLCQPVMNLWSSSPLTCHPVIPYQPHFQPREQQKQANTYRLLSIQCWLSDVLFICRQTTAHFICYLSQCNWVYEACEFKITVRKYGVSKERWKVEWVRGET